VLLNGVRQLDEGARIRTAILGHRDGGRGLADEEVVIVRRFFGCVDGEHSVDDIGRMLSLGRLEAVRIARELLQRGLVEVVAEAPGVPDLPSVVARFNQALAAIYAAVERVLPGTQLTDICRQYVRGGSHGNRALAGLALETDGRLNPSSVAAISSTWGGGEDALRPTVMVLTQYISFVLFTANSRLTPAAQAALTEKANAMLGAVFSAVV